MAPSDQFVKSAWMLASIAVVVAALYLAKGVLVPLTLAVLLSFLLSPVCDWLERHRFGRVPPGCQAFEFAGILAQDFNISAATGNSSSSITTLPACRKARNRSSRVNTAGTPWNSLSKF